MILWHSKVRACERLSGQRSPAKTLLWEGCQWPFHSLTSLPLKSKGNAPFQQLVQFVKAVNQGVKNKHSIQVRCTRTPTAGEAGLGGGAAESPPGTLSPSGWGELSWGSALWGLLMHWLGRLPVLVCPCASVSLCPQPGGFVQPKGTEQFLVALSGKVGGEIYFLNYQHRNNGWTSKHHTEVGIALAVNTKLQLSPGGSFKDRELATVAAVLAPRGRRKGCGWVGWEDAARRHLGACKLRSTRFPCSQGPSTVQRYTTFLRVYPYLLMHLCREAMWSCYFFFFNHFHGDLPLLSREYLACFLFEGTVCVRVCVHT